MSLYSRARARRALIHTVGFRILSQAATIISFIVLVRGLSEQDMGVYSLLYSVIPVIGTVASLGLDQVLKRYQPEYLQAGNTAAAAWLFRVVTRVRFVLNVALLLLVILGWNLLAPVFHLQAHKLDFELFTIVVLLYFQTLLLQSSLASHMLQTYSVGSVAVLSIGKLVSYLVVTQFFDFSLRAAILADTASYVVAYLFLAVAHLRNCSPRAEERGFKPPLEERRRLRRYALASNFNESSSLLLYVQTDNFFIAGLMNPLAVGAYAFYARINEMTANLVPMRLFENVVQPVLYATPREHAAERMPRYFTFLLNFSMIAQWPLMVYSLVYHREIVEVVFGGKFVEYSALMPVVLGFAWSNNVLSIPVTMLALYREDAGLILRSQLFGFYQVAAMFVLIPVLGLYGAAIATGTLHLFRNAWVWWKIRDTARWLNFRQALTTGLVIWGAAAAACFGLKLGVPAHAIVHLVAGGLICGVAGLVFLRSPAISASDRDILASVMHGREASILRWLGLAPAGAQLTKRA